MKIKPLESFKLLGTQLSLVKGKGYSATPAANQPDWEEEGKIFVNEILLVRGEYGVLP